LISITHFAHYETNKTILRNKSTPYPIINVMQIYKSNGRALFSLTVSPCL
jgi:hypothetical protein